MSARETIFSPSFGNRPSRLIGRENLLRRMIESLDTRPGSKDRAIVLLGQRGYGKTVLLWEFADRAREKGYVVANPTSVRENLLERITEKASLDAQRLISAPGPRITGGSVGVFGVSAGLQFDRGDLASPSSEAVLASLCRELSGRGIGLLLLVDELQASSSSVRSVVATYQELVGEGLNVAMVLAGVPASVSATLNDKVLTFLNRARKLSLEPLKPGEIDAFLLNAFEVCGIDVSKERRATLVEATHGSPYLMQLIGYYVAAYADGAGIISDDGLEAALDTAFEEYEQDVCGTMLSPLSNGDLAYVEAMATMTTPCKTSLVAERMGVSADYAQQYRRRLIEAGVIVASTRGEVAFSDALLESFVRKRMVDE